MRLLAATHTVAQPQKVLVVVQPQKSVRISADFAVLFGCRRYPHRHVKTRFWRKVQRRPVVAGKIFLCFATHIQTARFAHYFCDLRFVRVLFVHHYGDGNIFLVANKSHFFGQNVKKSQLFHYEFFSFAVKTQRCAAVNRKIVYHLAYSFRNVGKQGAAVVITAVDEIVLLVICDFCIYAGQDRAYSATL